MKYSFQKIQPDYTKQTQIAPVGFDSKNGVVGSHIVFWGKNSQEIEALTSKLPEIINFYFEMKQGKD